MPGAPAGGGLRLELIHVYSTVQYMKILNEVYVNLNPFLRRLSVKTRSRDNLGTKSITTMFHFFTLPISHFKKYGELSILSVFSIFLKVSYRLGMEMKYSVIDRVLVVARSRLTANSVQRDRICMGSKNKNYSTKYSNNHRKHTIEMSTVRLRAWNPCLIDVLEWRVKPI